MPRHHTMPRDQDARRDHVLRRPTTARAAALGVCAALALTGCGVTSAFFGPEPPEVVRTASDRAAEATQQSATVRVTASQSQLEQLVRGPESDPLDEQDFADLKPALDRLRASTFTTQVKATGEGMTVAKATDFSEMDAALAWSVDGDRKVEFVELGDSEVYFRADVLEIMRMAGEGGAAADDLQAQLDSAPDEMRWVADMVRGQWMGLDDALSEQLADGAQEQSGVSTESLTPEETERMRTSALDHSDITKLEDGRYEVKMHVKQVVEANRDIVEKSLRAQAEAEGTPTSEVPTVDEVLASLNDNTFDVVQSIDGDRITAVDMDPLQLADIVEPREDADADELAALEHLRGSELPVRTDYAEEVGDITVPEGATRITQEDLQRIGASGGGPTTL